METWHYPNSFTIRFLVQKIKCFWSVTHGHVLQVERTAAERRRESAGKRPIFLDKLFLLVLSLAVMMIKFKKQNGPADELYIYCLTLRFTSHLLTSKFKCFTLVYGLTLHQAHHHDTWACSCPVLTVARQYSRSINYCSLLSTQHMGSDVLTGVIWGAAGVLTPIVTHQYLLGHSGRTQRIYLQNKYAHEIIVFTVVIHSHLTHRFL